LVIVFFISNIKESIQSELDNFFAAIQASDTKIHKVTNSAFTQARSKLKHSAFIELDNLQTDLFYKKYEYKKWHGFRLIAVDGSSLYLPVSEETVDEFGVSEEKINGQKVVLARISEAFDPLNHIIIDSCIKPFVESEHSMMLKHVKKMKKGDLAIYDRNYPAFWVYKLHLSSQIDFCIRIQTTRRGKYVEEFIKSGKRELITELICSTAKMRQSCEKYNLDSNPIKCRLIRIELKSGEIEVLVSSLLDSHKFDYECFKELYHLRWPVEEDYKFLKQRVELGNFSGYTKEAIYQDFYAKIFVANLTSILAYNASVEVEKKKTKSKHKYKINWTNAIQNIEKSGYLLFIRSNVLNILVQLHNLFQINPNAVRPERTFCRKLLRGKKHYSMCYK